MSGFLDDMAYSSAERVRQAKQLESYVDLATRARRAARAAALRLSPDGFDLIAELKLRSPAAGVLGEQADDWLGRIGAYARGGAAAVSVLTEPSRFDGSLQHLVRAAALLAPLGVPVMRKDFLVDAYQVLEARAAGAGGVLLIIRMLPPGRLVEMLDAAAEHELFVLLEAFDGADLKLAVELLAARPPHANILLGINSRDLQTLKVVPERFALLAPLLPRNRHCVAESGVATAADTLSMRRLGYSLALVGTALMGTDDPAALLAAMLQSARTVNA